MNLLNKPGVYLFFLYLLPFFVFLPATLAQDLSFSIHTHRKKVIVIDPGHGGHDTGAVDSRGYKEKDATLAIAKKIEDVLTPEFSVWLTRQGDYWVDVEKRTALANSHLADVLVSLHASGSFGHKAQGTAVFCFGPGTSLGPQQKQGGNVVGTEDQLRMWDNIQSGHQIKSKLLRDLLHKNLLAKLDLSDRGVHQSPLLILRGADMPAALIEVGYMTNPAKERRLNNSRFIHDVAHAITEAIEEFFRQTGSSIAEKK